MTQQFSVFNDEVLRNPYPFFAGLRANSPVTMFGGMGLWGIAKYDDVVRILRDHEAFSSVVGARALAGEEVPPSMLFNDPPVHTRLRGLLSKAFTPRMVELQRQAIQDACDRMLDSISSQDEPDVVAELAYPLPVMVIAGMLGVQDGDMATFKRWSDTIIENVGSMIITGDDSGVAEVNVEFDAYFRARLQKLRRQPEDNLLSALVHAETEDGRLSEEDLLVMCRLLLVAGNETTTGLIVNSIRVFSEFPDVVARLRAEPDLIPTAIEEVLRFYPPFPATFRRATRDVDVRGVTIAQNQRVLVLLASANRDEDAFERADEFVVDRDPNRHVGFGMGIHYCLGAPLARLETDIALRTLLPRISSAELLASEDDSLLRPGGPKSLHVRFEPATASTR
jgi:cytochrome P450 family 109